MLFEWEKEFNGSIIVCDTAGIILKMNDKACETFARHGGRELVGKNLLDCHPEPSRTKLADMLKNETTNSYTIEKNGVKKLIYQAPWYKDNEYAGIVELSLEIPFAMPHFVRK